MCDNLRYVVLFREVLTLNTHHQDWCFYRTHHLWWLMAWRWPVHLIYLMHCWHYLLLTMRGTCPIPVHMWSSISFKCMSWKNLQKSGRPQISPSWRNFSQSLADVVQFSDSWLVVDIVHFTWCWGWSHLKFVMIRKFDSFGYHAQCYV